MTIITLGAIQVLRNADGGREGGSNFPEKALRRCNVQRYWRYEGVGWGPISRKKRYVTLEWSSSLLRIVQYTGCTCWDDPWSLNPAITKQTSEQSFLDV